MIEPLRNLAALVRAHYAFVKMGFLLALVLVLLIPLDLIGGLIAERMARRDAVLTEIGQTWGAPQTLSGPVLVIPYRYTVESTRWDNSEPVEVEGQAYFLPDELRVEARAEPETRYRGLFDATVYRAGLRVAGRFGALDLEALDLDRDKMLWDEAFLALGVTDLRGTTGEPFVSWNGAPAAFRPGTGSAPWQNGIEAPIALDPAREDPAEFGFDLPVAGSENLSFTPAGKTTAVSVASAWPHPSFDGAYLPAEREIGDDGFSARWTLSYLGRGFPQSWTSHSENLTRLSERFAASRFGVSSLGALDQTRRALHRADFRRDLPVRDHGAVEDPHRPVRPGRLRALSVLSAAAFARRDRRLRAGLRHRGGGLGGADHALHGEDPGEPAPRRADRRPARRGLPLSLHRAAAREPGAGDRRARPLRRPGRRDVRHAQRELVRAQAGLDAHEFAIGAHS
jgi:inner membrane protein